MIKYLLILIFLCSCNTHQVSEKQKIANSIRNNVAQDLYKKYGLKPLGSGGQMMDQIKMLYLGFSYKQSLTINDARELIVSCVNIFVNAVNEDEKIRPYLANYPFNPKNIELAIFFRNENDNGVPEGELLFVATSDREIRYVIRDPITKEHRTILTESFEQAANHCRINNNYTW